MKNLLEMQITEFLWILRLYDANVLKNNLNLKPLNQIEKTFIDNEIKKRTHIAEKTLNSSIKKYGQNFEKYCFDEIICLAGNTKRNDNIRKKAASELSQRTKNQHEILHKIYDYQLRHGPMVENYEIH